MPRSRPDSKPVEDSHASDERRALGNRLRMLRVRRELSLATVAIGTGLSRSFIALLEAGDSDVSVSRLLRLAEFYGVWLSDLVGTAAPTVEVTRTTDAALARSAQGKVSLLSKGSVRNILPFRVELGAGERIEGGMSHTGEEFIHCVVGVVELEVVNAVHRLEAGDTASYPGRLPHSYANIGPDAALLVGATARYG